MSSINEVAIVVVSFNGVACLPKALASCRRHADGATVFVVDNDSSDGSVELVRRDFGRAVVLPQMQNLGFAGGCNAGIRAALDRHAQFILLLNQDATIEAGTVEELIAVMEGEPEAAAVQPAILLPDGRVNTLGNCYHYLGFGFAGGNGYALKDAVRRLPWMSGPAEERSDALRVPYCSGAVVLLRSKALRDVGLMAEPLFLYHEDMELGMRFRLAGWSNWVAPHALSIHDYSFSRNQNKWYFLERNRYFFLLSHYARATLALVLLPLVVAEIGIWLAAIRGGWAGEKLRSYGYWIRGSNRKQLWEHRSRTQALRRVSDGQLLRTATGVIDSAELGESVGARVFNATVNALWLAIRPVVVR